MSMGMLQLRQGEREREKGREKKRQMQGGKGTESLTTQKKIKTHCWSGFFENMRRKRAQHSEKGQALIEARPLSSLPVSQ